ncbi:MAG: phosphatase PAP2 family protein [Candidatus Pacebacteria bacterium]|nr:phosphatase PAP2 family protein [Candidatus Paceibacterota bacterium]MCF7862526.1 phosphatase PAP2 family protein [Candidatus Paceibacterota bacterium]
MNSITSINNVVFLFFQNFANSGLVGDIAYFFSYYIFYTLIFVGFVWAIFFSKEKMFNFAVLFSSLLSVTIIVNILKTFFEIPRPFLSLPIIPFLYESGFSFPSGHSAIAFALAFSLYFLHKKLGVTFIIFAIIIAISRMILGVHYPFDVLVGMIVGMMTSYFFVKLFNKTK